MVDASLAANQLLMAMENFICTIPYISCSLAIINGISILLVNLLHSSLDPSTVDVIFSLLLPWSRATEGSMRRAALSLLKLALGTFVKDVEFEPGAPSRFSQGHLMVAKVNLFECKSESVNVFIEFFRLFRGVPIRKVRYAIWPSIASDWFLKSFQSTWDTAATTKSPPSTAWYFILVHLSCYYGF